MVVLSTFMVWIRVLVRFCMHCWSWIIDIICQFVGRTTSTVASGPALLLDTGRRIRMGKQIAEGGFSFIFEAYDDVDRIYRSNNPNQPPYVIKRIVCPEPEMLEACTREVTVYRSVPHHAHLIELLGFVVVKEPQMTCYMLFPYLPVSLRQVVHERTLLTGATTMNKDNKSVRAQPFSELQILQLFWGLLQGVHALHAVGGWTHRDIKLDNVHLPYHADRALQAGSGPPLQAILMDFGSAGPLLEPIETRRQVMNIIEQAASHTTMPYRPPELFEGGIRAGDNTLDFRLVDVWSLGCTVFAMMFGASPFELEFTRNSRHHHQIYPVGIARSGSFGSSQNSTGGTTSIRIVECTQLSILKQVPWPLEGTEPASWYTSEMLDLVSFLLAQNRTNRPHLQAVLDKVESMLLARGGNPTNNATKLAGGLNPLAGRDPYRDHAFDQHAKHNNVDIDNDDVEAQGGVALTSRTSIR